MGNKWPVPIIDRNVNEYRLFNWNDYPSSLAAMDLAAVIMDLFF